MHIVTKRLRVDLRGFYYRVALYHSYLHMKFDDEIKRESLRISSIISDQPASKVKLTSRLCFFSIQMSQLLVSLVWQQTNV